MKVSKNDQQMVFESINIGDKMVKKKERKIWEIWIVEYENQYKEVSKNWQVYGKADKKKY